ncbi:MAG TPA: hypothetical protein VHL34_24505 [Rhizomicrobium sp.]|jgi:hypothetical protein|nr:hypothetical protein [Rhizomicrobium sp.]
MRTLTTALLAAAALSAVSTAYAAETIISDDFQNSSASGWTVGEKGQIGTSDFKGNVSLRLTAGASATKIISTQGYKDVSMSAAFAAIDLGTHGGCVLEASADGNNWIKIHRIGKAEADGVKLHAGSRDVPELDNLAKVTLRLANTDNDAEANCFADNIVVSGTSNGGPKAAQPVVSQSSSAAPAAGAVTWDPNSVK